MKPFQWSEEYAIGHAAIDNQHRKIVDIINLLHSVLQDGAKSKAGAGEVFDQLAHYVMTHFAYEEQLIADAGYPIEKIIEHRRQHDRLLNGVREVSLAYQTGDTEALAELLPYLYGAWLIDHICYSDKDYATYLQDSPSRS